MLDLLVANKVGKARKVTRNGREYYVAPMVMIVPGVLSGSKGSLMYPPDEIAKSVQQWNDVPILLNHPIINGLHTSGKSPEVQDRWKIGRVYDARVENGALKADAWIDVERANVVDPRVVQSIEAGRPIEISTGLYTENVPQQGTYNGRSYDYLAKNYVSDHLAVLLENAGACSVSDGCGLNVNQQTGDPQCPT